MIQPVSKQRISTAQTDSYLTLVDILPNPSRSSKRFPYPYVREHRRQGPYPAALRSRGTLGQHSDRGS